MKHTYIIILSLLLFSLHLQAQVRGCTDPLSKNFNPIATINDGSCFYASESIKPIISVILTADVEETSGLIYWDGHLYTHNDDTDTSLYGLDTITETVTNKFSINGVINEDWEELAQDSSYIYIGDFGNNHSGNRGNLNIIRVHKDSLQRGVATAGIIHFTYSDQTFTNSENEKKTDFDCEAFIVSKDSIYLFTKQWKSKKTSLYSLPKTPGRHTAQLKATYDIDGLITGATYLEDKKIVVLSGYSMALKPFFYLLYDFKENDFFSGNKRKIKIKLPFHQIEGITTANGTEFYITNENFVSWPVKVKQKLHKFDLSPYLQSYLKGQKTTSRRN